MKRYTMIGAGLFGLALLAVPARAQQPAQQPFQQPHPLTTPAGGLKEMQDISRIFFKLADDNNDGQISQQEAVDVGNQIAGGYFFRADKNGDGTVSPDEARQARESFLASKPWLRYAVETAKASKPATGNQGSNILSTLAATFDTNNDKKLEASELRQAIQTTVQGEFAVADTDRNGQLTPAEVNAAVAGMTRQAADMAFRQADTDGNGQISQAEFEKSIVEPARTAFKIIDLNHDGQISQQEAQTARQVIMANLRALNFPEPSNSPRQQVNRALGSPTQPGQPVAPAAPPPGR